VGIACAIGLFWSLAATIFFTLPGAVAVKPKLPQENFTERNWNMRKIITVICLVALLAIGVRAAPYRPLTSRPCSNVFARSAPQLQACRPTFKSNERSLVGRADQQQRKNLVQAPNKFRVERKGNARASP